MADYTVNLKLAVQGSKELAKLNKQVNLARKRLDKAGIESESFTKAIGNLIKVENKYGQALDRRTKAIDNALRAQTGMQTVEQREHQLLARGNRLRDLRMRKEQALTRQQMLRRGVASAVGSGIIGGGFPLLFGQGPTAAIGGGLGGLAGGALSAIPGMGQFGFALSIAGTTIGSALDDLAKALAKPTENIEKLVSKLGLVDTPTGKLALELEKLGLTSSAAALLLEEFETQFGLSQGQIKENAEKMTKFNNEINQLGTEITLLMANSLGPFMAGIIDFARKLNQEKVIENLQIQLMDQIRATGGDKVHFDQIRENIKRSAKRQREEEGLSFAEYQNRQANMYRNLLGFDTSAFEFKTNTSSGASGMGKDSNLATQTFEQKQIKPLQQALIIEQNRLTMSNERLAILKEQFTLDNISSELELARAENEKLSTDELKKKIQKLEAQVGLQKQVLANAKALIDPFRQISDMIQIEMGNGIKDLIKGTRTLNDVMRNMLNKMADAFLNLAIFGNIGGGSITGGLLGSIFRAEGGPVKAGGSYIVGERGPELFKPSASGNIIPNDALGGSTNIVVNVDASGSAVEGDEDRGRELGRLISVAVQSEIIQQKRPRGLLA